MTLLPSHVIPLPLFSKEGHPEPNVTALRRKTLFLGFSSLNTYPFPGPRKSWDMSRKRHRLVPETFGLKKRREQVPIEAVPVRGESGSARAAVAELVQLFPRGLFEDALPPIALRSQVYSLLPDRTVADRQLVRGVRATDKSFPASWALSRSPFTQTLSRPASHSVFQQALGLSGQTLRCHGECCRPC